MSFLKNILKKKDDEIFSDYEIKVPKSESAKIAAEASAESRSLRSTIRKIEAENEARRLRREMEREEFQYQIEQEERLERLKGLKLENLQLQMGDKEGGGGMEDLAFMKLIETIQNKSNPISQPQQTFNQVPPQAPQEEETGQPMSYDSRFTNEQMKEMINKLPPQIINTFKNMEEGEILQAYDLIKQNG